MTSPRRLDPDLEQALKKLRLGKMIPTLPERIALAEKSKMSVEELMLLVFRDEIDRLALKRNPVLFGAGIPLFESGDYDPAAFRPTAVTPFESGVVLAEYTRA